MLESAGPCRLGEKDGVEDQVVVGGGSDCVEFMRPSESAVTLVVKVEGPGVGVGLVPVPCRLG